MGAVHVTALVPSRVVNQASATRLDRGPQRYLLKGPTPSGLLGGARLAHLWFTTGLTLGTALLLALTGWFILRREVAPDLRPALRAFAFWWFSAAALLLLVASRSLLFMAGVRDPSVYILIRTLLAIPLSLALPALLYYLIFIYTGRRSMRPVLAFAYIIFFAYTLFYFSYANIESVEATRWSVETVGSTEAPTWMTALFGILLAGPILAGIVAYATLYTKVTGREQRFRIATVSIAFTIWFLPLLLAFLLGWNREEWFPLVYQVPGLFAALLIILAYRPPRVVRREDGDQRSTPSGGTS